MWVNCRRYSDQIPSEHWFGGDAVLWYLLLASGPNVFIHVKHLPEAGCIIFIGEVNCYRVNTLFMFI